MRVIGTEVNSLKNVLPFAEALTNSIEFRWLFCKIKRAKECSESERRRRWSRRGKTTDLAEKELVELLEALLVDLVVVLGEVVDRDELYGPDELGPQDLAPSSKHTTRVVRER